MSRSNNTEIVNPSKRFYRWNGESGGFQYYDKQTEKRVDVPLPFQFLVLDTLATVRGFNDADQSGYWSNEVRDIKKDILTVRTSKGICAKGLYESVITDRACTGAKFCQSVYVAVKADDGSLEIANIQMVGSALGAWIEFRKKNKVFDGAIAVKTMIEGKKGKTTYQIPVFQKIETTPETDEIAKDLDKELQEYLSAYMKKTSQEIADSHVEEKVEPLPSTTVDPSNPLGVPEKESDLPF
jgi:hypothetical protein